MNLKRSFLKRKHRFQKWKDRVLFKVNPELFINRFKKKLPLINSLLPQVNINSEFINFYENKEIPVLAWGLKVTAKGDAIINYGSQVHIFDNGIVEGTWDGEFSKFNFNSSPHFFGSGIKIDNDTAILSCPSHFYEGIFLFNNKKNGDSYFSNSLNYVLKDNIDLLNDEFEKIFAQVCNKNDEITAKGVFDIETLLYDSDDFSLHVFYYHNVVISSQKCEIKAKKPSSQSYKNFQEYKNYVLKVLNALRLNSNDVERVKKYHTLATLSSGYDSSAVASLLVDVGEVEAVTIDVNIAGNDDSGLEIAKYLGLDCHPCPHPLAIENTIDNLGTFNYSASFAKETSEFLATIGHGDEIVFQSFDNYLENKAVYTGHSGDDLWSTASQDFIGIPITIINGKSLSEYRLRKNFFHVPLPVIGTVYPFSLYKINFQNDMKEYWIEGRYNRPIARRMIEEKGVPRGVFANSKRSTNPYILNTNEHKKNAFQLIMKRYSWKS